MDKRRMERALNSYFETHYSKYESEVEWYVNPTEYSWKFYIPSLRMTVKLLYDAENDMVIEAKSSKS